MGSSSSKESDGDSRGTSGALHIGGAASSSGGGSSSSPAVAPAVAPAVGSSEAASGAAPAAGSRRSVRSASSAPASTSKKAKREHGGRPFSEYPGKPTLNITTEICQVIRDRAPAAEVHLLAMPLEHMGPCIHALPPYARHILAPMEAHARRVAAIELLGPKASESQIQRAAAKCITGYHTSPYHSSRRLHLHVLVGGFLCNDGRFNGRIAADGTPDDDIVWQVKRDFLCRWRLFNPVHALRRLEVRELRELQAAPSPREAEPPLHEHPPTPLTISKDEMLRYLNENVGFYNDNDPKAVPRFQVVVHATDLAGATSIERCIEASMETYGHTRGAQHGGMNCAFGTDGAKKAHKASYHGAKAAETYVVAGLMEAGRIRYIDHQFVGSAETRKIDEESARREGYETVCAWTTGKTTFGYSPEYCALNESRLLPLYIFPLTELARYEDIPTPSSSPLVAALSTAEQKSVVALRAAAWKATPRGWRWSGRNASLYQRYQDNFKRGRWDDQARVLCGVTKLLSAAMAKAELPTAAQTPTHAVAHVPVGWERGMKVDAALSRLAASGAAGEAIVASCGDVLKNAIEELKGLNIIPFAAQQVIIKRSGGYDDKSSPGTITAIDLLCIEFPSMQICVGELKAGGKKPEGGRVARAHLAQAAIGLALVEQDAKLLAKLRAAGASSELPPKAFVLATDDTDAEIVWLNSHWEEAGPRLLKACVDEAASRKGGPLW